MHDKIFNDISSFASIVHSVEIEEFFYHAESTSIETQKFPIWHIYLETMNCSIN